MQRQAQWRSSHNQSVSIKLIILGACWHEIAAVVAQRVRMDCTIKPKTKETVTLLCKPWPTVCKLGVQLVSLLVSGSFGGNTAPQSDNSIGSKNPNVPSKMPHRFNVLAFFFITDVWCEKLNGHVTYMVRMQKIDIASKSWWAPITSGPVPMAATLKPVSPKSQACPQCQFSSPEIFQQGWTCLQWDCKAHFKFFAVAGDGVEIQVTDGTLDYNEMFMNKRQIWKQPSTPGRNFPALSPPLPKDEDCTHLGQFGYEQICKYGIVCPQCNSCIRRIFFDRWECETQDCNFVHQVKQYAVSVDTACIGGAKPLRVFCHDLIKSFKLEIGKFKVTVYELPGESGETIGRLYHLKPDKSLKERDDGADALFGEMQTADLGLKRNPVKNKGRKWHCSICICF